MVYSLHPYNMAWHTQENSGHRSSCCGTAGWWSGIAAAMAQVAAMAWIWFLAWELPYAAGVAKKRKEKERKKALVALKKKKKKERNVTQTHKATTLQSLEYKSCLCYQCLCFNHYASPPPGDSISDLRGKNRKYRTPNYMWISDKWQIIFKSKYVLCNILDILILKDYWHGVPIVAKWKWIWLQTMRLWVRSLAPISGLSIWHCLELWGTSQMRLGSHVAVAVMLTRAIAPIGPVAWEPPYAMGTDLKSKKNKERKEKKKFQYKWVFCTLSGNSTWRSTLWTYLQNGSVLHRVKSSGF